ncbi:hypothetical protein E2C01_074095 [Portunus trituberculatus]|uniref:Uncharacterized protein n=1 Tax=Portunus trituberculatus TaxID=210409 RepID=A0A5B7IBA2_PORTR|nr:hypothetical protein [Portunus trituberculatus]
MKTGIKQEKKKNNMKQMERKMRMGERYHDTTCRLFCPSVSRTLTHHWWEAILGSLNSAAEVCSFSRIRHHQLVIEVSSHLTELLRSWFADHCLQQWTP